MVERRRITCPETGRLEEVELDPTPLGRVVTGCSRALDGALACARECAARMDRRDRAGVDDRERVVVVANLDDRASRIASGLATSLVDEGLAVDLAELGMRSMPPLEDYDAVVIGARLRFGRHARAAIDYIRAHREQLAAMPAFFYSVGGRGVLDRDGYTRRMTRRTGWHPTRAIGFPDASAVEQADLRAFARQISDEIPAVPPLAAG